MEYVEDEHECRPRVLVLMATFNGSKWIVEQIQSVFAQRDVTVTLLVRDDASTDDTVDKIESQLALSESCRLIRAELPSGSAAGNFFELIDLADVTRHHFVAFADQDDIWDPIKLSRAVECLSATDFAGYSSGVRAFWTNGRTKRLLQNPVPTRADYLFEGGGQGCTYLLRSEVFSELQSILRNHRARVALLHYHDWTIYALCRALGRTWFIDDWASLQYRQHEGNDTGARSGISGIAKRLARIRSGWYGAQIRLIGRLCASIATDSNATTIEQYMTLSDSTRDGLRGRLAMSAFVLRDGRRRKLDRLVMTWAALMGYLAVDKVNIGPHSTMRQ